MTNLPFLYLTLLTHIDVFNYSQFNIHEVSVQIRQEAKQKIKKKTLVQELMCPTTIFALDWGKVNGHSAEQ